MTHITPTSAELIDDITHKQHALRSRQTSEVADAITVYSDGRAWDSIQVASETRHWMGMASSAYIEVCKRVAWAHQVLPAQSWVAWVEQEVGLRRRAAYMCVTIARKVIANGSSVQRLLDMSRTKVFELASALDPEELQAIAGGEGLPGLGDFDEIDKLSVRELKKRLRSKRDELDATKAKLKEAEADAKRANEKVGELTIGKGESAHELKRVKQIRGDFQLAFAKLNKQLGDLLEDEPGEDVLGAIAGLYAEVETRLHEMRSELDHLGVEPALFVPNGGGLEGRLTSDADELLGHLGNPENLPGGHGLKRGDVFRIVDLRVPGWDTPKLAAALTELIARKVIDFGNDPGEYVFEHHIPDHRPGWLQEQLDGGKPIERPAAQVVPLSRGRTDIDVEPA